MPAQRLLISAVDVRPLDKEHCIIANARSIPFFDASLSNGRPRQTSPRRSVTDNDPKARRISAAIDKQLRQEHKLIAKRKNQHPDVKVLLLGQADSGKSTLQKQLQLYCAATALDQERPSWRPVVHFSVIKVVRMILDALDVEASAPQDEKLGGLTDLGSDWRNEAVALRARLLPLIVSEAARSRSLDTCSSAADKASFLATAGPGPMADMAARQLAESVGDVEALWAHPAVRALLRLRRLELEESAEFFLGELRRLVEPGYLPSTKDILRVRVQTLGVTEREFYVRIYNWLLYDVGGARTQRHAWTPYCEDATAIIFLVPISAFDQYLEEDPRTSRIEDSLQLFTEICTNKLLKASGLVLLFNKTDLLKKKLEAGIEVKKYISSYGDRPNRYDDVAAYFRAHFRQVHKRTKAQAQQTIFVHFTSMLDITATRQFIVDKACAAVKESVFRAYLRQQKLA